jgi:preprotein translocase subunit SecB
MSDEKQPSFQIEKIYVKDVSLEVPNAPQVFVNPESPQLEVQVNTGANAFAEGYYGVTLTVTVTARSGDKTIFLVEAAQAGIFAVKNVPADDINPLLGIACPTILYPYARETISDLITRAGFPPVLLAPVSFEALYLERQQQASGGGPKIELAS